MLEKYQKQCISMLEAAKLFPSWINCHKLWVENHRILKSEPDIDIQNLDKLITGHEKNKLAVCRVFGTRCIGEIYLNLGYGHMSEVEAWIKRAIEFNSKYGTHWELARDYALYADWYKKKGDTSKAKEQLTKAIDLFREMRSRVGWVTRDGRKACPVFLTVIQSNPCYRKI